MTATASPLQQFELLDFRPSRTQPTLVPPPPPVEPGMSEAVRQLRATLEGAVAAKVTSATELIRSIEKARRDDSIPTTLDAVDTLLGGGLRRGKAIEIVARRASGRFSVVMASLVAATSMGEAVALIDLGDHFDPQIAEENGVDLRRLLWIRPHTMKQAVMAAEMVIATGFQLVAVDAGVHPIKGKRRAPDAAWVRLARAAEAHGAAFLVSSPFPLMGTMSEGVLRGAATHAKWLGKGNAPRLLAGVETKFTLERHRHLRPGASATCSLRAES